MKYDRHAEMLRTFAESTCPCGGALYVDKDGAMCSRCGALKKGVTR